MDGGANLRLKDDNQRATGKGELLFALNEAKEKMQTTLNAKFVIHGFDVSWNGQIIEEDVCKENMETLIGQPVLVKYYNEGNAKKDHLGTHEVYVTKNRDTGEDMQATDTVAIGTFQSVAIEDVDFNGGKKRCLVGNAELWADRYWNVCSLLNEWLENDVHIFCSCEYTFRNYEMKDNVQYIKSPYAYTGHTILNSEEKDGYGIVLPAYDEATMVCWNEALHKDEQSNNQKGVNKLENVFLTALNELSMGETRRGIYDALANVMTAAEYQYMWLSDWQIYNDYFVYETYENDEWKHYKVGYSKSGDDITVDYASKTEVKYESVMVEVNEVQAQIETAVNEAKVELEAKIEDLNGQLSEKEAALNTAQEEVVAQKETVVSLNETITSLNATIEGLSDYKEKYEAEVYNQKLNEATEKYKAKFEKLNAMDKFELDETQTLIAETIDAEKSLNAKDKLADMFIELLDSVNVQHKTQKNTVTEPGTSLNNLGGTNTKKVIRDIDTYTIED